MRNKFMFAIKRGIAILMSIVLLLLCNACSFDFTSVDSLMRAPKLTGDYAAIEKAFEDAVGTSVALLSPRHGEFRTSFVLYDYDADAEQEVIVFYLSNVDESRAHINFIDCVNDEWVSVADEPAPERDIHELLFKDLNNDGLPEIIVNFNTKHSNRLMTVYYVTPRNQNNHLQIQLLSTVQYSSFACIDMDMDGSNEILYTVYEVSVDSGISNPFVRVLKLEDDEQGKRIDVETSLLLYNGITSVEGMAVDSTADAVRVYIDCLYHDPLTMITEVVTWTAENGYVLLLHKYESAALLKTTRTSSLHTVDLNKDGLMEIPGEYEMPDSVFENVAEGMIPLAIGRNYYNCAADGTLSLHSAIFLDPAGRYSLDLLTLGFYGRVSILYNCITEATTFYVYDAVNQQRGERLFTLTVKDNDSDRSAYFDISSTGTALGLTPEIIQGTLTMIETE